MLEEYKWYLLNEVNGIKACDRSKPNTCNRNHYLDFVTDGVKEMRFYLDF